MTRHWSINGRFLAQPRTGVQRYALEVVRALDACVAAGHPSTADLALELVVPAGVAPPPFLRAIATRAVAGGDGHLWEQRLPLAVTGGLLSLCNVGPVAQRRHVVCIHDLNTRLAPHSYTRGFRWLYRLLQPALGRSAAALATVSQYSAAQLARFGIAAPGRVAVIPNGHEHVLRVAPRHTPATRAAAGARTIVLLGSLAPHKNAGAILALADALAAADLSLAVVGAADARLFRPLGAPPAAGNVAWLGRIDDPALAALLGDSLCLAFPSLCEGFGLPPLEAMALGCPVVASDRTSLPEVCGDAALFAPPTDRAAWLRHFQRLAADDALRSELIARGHAQAARFRWSDAALAYLALMARVDGGGAT
jgi:glycosyltransferase involved in cell wall biosynthesis